MTNKTQALFIEPLENVFQKFKWEGNWEDYSPSTLVAVFEMPNIELPYHVPKYSIAIGDAEEMTKAIFRGHVFLGFGMVLEPNVVGLIKTL